MLLLLLGRWQTSLLLLLLHGLDIEHSLLCGSCSSLAGFTERLHVHPPHHDLLPQSTSRPWLHLLLLVLSPFVNAAATATLGLSSPRITIIRTLAYDIHLPLQALLKLVLVVMLQLLLMMVMVLLLLLHVRKVFAVRQDVPENFVLGAGKAHA